MAAAVLGTERAAEAVAVLAVAAAAQRCLALLALAILADLESGSFDLRYRSSQAGKQVFAGNPILNLVDACANTLGEKSSWRLQSLSNVWNQRELLIILLANVHIRLEPKPDPLSKVGGVHFSLLSKVQHDIGDSFSLDYLIDSIFPLFRKLIEPDLNHAQYMMSQRESFTNLADVWTKETEANSTNKDCIKMLVGNKVDKDDERTVTRE